jgi:Bacterial extracellular solute-binding proteins, family 3
MMGRMRTLAIIIAVLVATGRPSRRDQRVHLDRDQGTDRAVRSADLQGERARSGLIGTPRRHHRHVGLSMEKKMHLCKKVWMAPVILAVLAPSALADALDAIKLRGKLLVGVSESTPPFSFRQPGDSTIAGYDIDLVQAVTKRIGVALEMVALSSAERIPLLQQGKVDLVATSMTRTRERERDIDFSHIYFVTPHAVIVRTWFGPATAMPMKRTFKIQAD